MLIPKDLPQSQWKDLSGTLLYLATRRPETPSYGSNDKADMLRIVEVVIGIEWVDMNAAGSNGMTALISVARDAQKKSSSSRAHVLSALLSKGADVNAVTPEKQSALHFLAKRGFQLGLLEVLQHNPDVDGLDDEGMTPLHWAIDKDHIDAVRLLLQHAKDRRAKGKLSTCTAVEQWTSDGLLPLHLASSSGKHAIISLMWEMGEIPDLNVRSREKCIGTSLHLAVWNGHIGVVEALIDLGAEIDCLDIEKRTPLHMAADCGFDDIARFLVSKGARVECETKYGFTPWMCAALEGHAETKDFLVKCADEVRLRRKGTEHETSERTRTYDGLSESESKLETEAPNLEAPIIESDKSETESQRLSKFMVTAVQTNNTAICKALVDCGSDPNDSLDENASTALHIACDWKSLDVIKLLLQSGAQVNTEVSYGDFPIHRAAMVNSTEIIKELVGAGADLFARTKDRMQTPLHLAARKGHLEVVQTILELAGSSQILETTSVTQEANHVEASSCEREDSAAQGKKFPLGEHHDQNIPIFIPITRDSG